MILITWKRSGNFAAKDGKNYPPEENDSVKVDQDISVNDILRMFFKS
jgi:hypothetical protein